MHNLCRIRGKAGNMLKKTVNGKTTTFAFDDANQIISSTTDGVTTRYAYDAAGRLVKEGSKTYTYGYLDKVMSVTEGDRTLTLNGKNARIDGGDFRTFAKTIGLNERQAAKAVSRVADALASSLDAGFGDSLVTDEFASGFARLVRANLDRIV